MIDVKGLEIKCAGRWFSIYEHFGINVGTGHHQECPICGGNDRFRIERDGSSYYCNQCSPGTGFTLVMKHLGINFKEALKRITEVLGGGYIKVDAVQNKNEMSVDDKKKMLNKIWSGSVPLSGGDPVSRYLHNRKLTLSPENIQYVPELYERETKLHYTAMIARFVTKDGTPICLHRTYLQDNKKADIKSNKKMTPTTQPMAGGAVRLFSPDNEMFESGVLGIGEGIENSIAATQIFNIATWAALSTFLMESFEPPDNIRKIVIFSDNDVSYTGQKAAYVLANKLYKKDLIVSVETPEINGMDWNDILLEK